MFWRRRLGTCPKPQTPGAAKTVYLSSLFLSVEMPRHHAALNSFLSWHFTIELISYYNSVLYLNWMFLIKVISSHVSWFHGRHNRPRSPPSLYWTSCLHVLTVFKIFFEINDTNCTRKFSRGQKHKKQKLNIQYKQQPVSTMKINRGRCGGVDGRYYSTFLPQT